MNEHLYDVIAVIPAYNEEEVIDKVISKTQSFVDLVIVCDDGSTDNTSKIIRNNNVVFLRNSKKMGKGYSLKCLFKEAEKYNPQMIITLDGDGQHDPNDIPKLITPILSNEYDLVVGSRFVYGSFTDISYIRNFGLQIINLLHNILLKYPHSDSQCGFRAFGRKAIDIMIKCNENGYGIETEQLILAMKYGLRMTEVPVTVRYRGLNNTSKMNSVKHAYIITKFVLYNFLRDMKASNVMAREKYRI